MLFPGIYDYGIITKECHSQYNGTGYLQYVELHVLELDICRWKGFHSNNLLLGLPLMSTMGTLMVGVWMVCIPPRINLLSSTLLTEDNLTRALGLLSFNHEFCLNTAVGSDVLAIC